MPNAYGPNSTNMFNQWRRYVHDHANYWANFNQPIPDYELFKRYMTEVHGYTHAYIGVEKIRPMPPIEAALEQFRLGARASVDGGNPEQNIAFARGDLAPAALPAVPTSFCI